MSFIDVLASALGAAVLLFVILAATPPIPTIVGHADVEGTFIRYKWTVGTVEGDLGALMRILIWGPLDKDFQYVPLQDLRGPLVVECPPNIRGLASYLLIGFAADSMPGDRSISRTFVLRLNKPAPGKWRVGIMYYKRNDDTLTAPKPVTITAETTFDSDGHLNDGAATILTADGARSPAGSSAQLSFADQYLSPIVTETGADSKSCVSTVH